MLGEIRGIEAFVNVYRSGSITAAARIMHVTQPALSVAIRKLEADWNVKLFLRDGRSVRPTPAAALLIDGAERVLAEAAAFESLLTVTKRGAKTTTQIAVPPSIGTLLIPGILARFEAACPDVKLIIHDVSPRVSERLVTEGKVEFAIGTLDGSAVLDKSLASIRVADFSMVVLCHRDSPLARRRKIGWSDVNAFPIVAVPPSVPIGQWLAAMFAASGETFVPSIEVTKFTSAIAMAQQNLGCAIVPSYLGGAYDAATIVARRVDAVENTGVLQMVMRADTPLSEPAKMLFDLIRQDVVRRVQITGDK